MALSITGPGNPMCPLPGKEDYGTASIIRRNPCTFFGDFVFRLQMQLARNGTTYPIDHLTNTRRLESLATMSFRHQRLSRHMAPLPLNGTISSPEPQRLAQGLRRTRWKQTAATRGQVTVCQPGCRIKVVYDTARIRKPPYI
jgi:hypothetical protein